MTALLYYLHSNKNVSNSIKFSLVKIDGIFERIMFFVKRKRFSFLYLAKKGHHNTP